MSETGKLIAPKPTAAVWEGIQQFATLPGWLVSTRDTGRVSQALAGLVPEFCEAGWELKGCTVSHVRYKKGAWLALYTLTTRRPGAPEDETIELQGQIFPPGKLSTEQPRVSGSLGSVGWRADFPALDLTLEAREEDTDLAALNFLTDPEESRRYLEVVLRSHLPAEPAGYGELRLKSSNPSVVRYNRGSRCTVVYHLEYAEPRPEWPNLVVAKTYHGEKGRNAFESMSALWNSPLGSSPVVKIAEPLAYQPDNRVLVQGPIREEFTLEEMVFAAVRDLPQTGDSARDLARYMSKTAAGLAALHNSGVTMGASWTWKDQLEEVQVQIDRLAQVLPNLSAAAAPLLDRLDRLAAGMPADPPVPSHGTFRTPQVLIYQGEIGFIDFDSFRQSEPADDLALFLGEMFNSGLMPQKSDGRKSGQSLDAQVLQQRFDYLLTIQNRFLEAYRRDHPVTLQRVLLWEALNMFMFILHTWTKVKLADVNSTVFLLERFLEKSGIVGA